MNPVIASHAAFQSRTDSSPFGDARKPLFTFCLSGWV